MALRNKAELQALFADNTTGNIGANDLRDLVDSLSPIGGIRLTTPPVSLSISTTPLLFDAYDAYSIENTFPEGPMPPANGLIVVPPSGEGAYLVSFICAFETGGTREIKWNALFNGTPVGDGYEVEGINNRTISFNVSFYATFAEGDTLGLTVQTLSGSDSMDVRGCELIMTRVAL